MSQLDPVHEAIEHLEWQDAKQDETPRSRLAALTRRTALTGGAAGLAATLLAACGGDKSTAPSKAQSGGGTPATGIFKSSKKYKFVFVNHVTTNPFFVPTKYGAEDACKLLGCSYQWTGSENSNVNEMVNTFNTAITGGADGIAIALVDKKAFNQPTDAALKAKIPVVSYNADEPNNSRLACIGQDLFVSGQEMGKHIAELVPSGDVALFIATPGQSNIQPRIDGARDTLKSHSSITTHVITTGAALPAELSAIDSYATGHADTKGTSRSTREARRAWRRSSRSTISATRASRAAVTTSRRTPRSSSPTTRSTSRSTSSSTCRASCRCSSSTCTRCRAGSRASPT